MGSTALWGTPPTPISEKTFSLLKSLYAVRWHHIIRNELGNLPCAGIVNAFENWSFFILICLIVRFVAYISESYRECECDSEVPKSAVCNDRHTLAIHLTFLLLQFFSSSNDEEQIFLATLSPWQWGDHDRDLGQLAKLVYLGHHGSRQNRLDKGNTMVLK